ncbi:MAG TPA: hypothetical protein PK509_18130 [Catalimonadaceae bacterium]|nr:hypothetical protein [Catalimonadaceae bacterium]
MKTKSFKDGVFQNQKENQSLFRALVALLVFALAACSSVDKDPVTPVDIFSQPIGRIEAEADTTGKAIISLRSLKVDQSKPFLFKTRDFKHGSFKPLNDSLFQFVPTDTSDWEADSGWVVLTQEARTKEGFVKINNKRKQPPVWPVTFLVGTPLPDMPVFYMENGDSRNFDNVNGLSETGSIIDSIWGFMHVATVNSAKTRITYLAQGGLGNFLNFGTDFVYYRIKRTNGQYFRGMIPIIIGDTCLARARNDEQTLPSGSGILSVSTLAANDLGCLNVTATSPVVYRLEPLTYIGKKRINTQFGQIRDTVDAGSNPAFYYKRFATGTQPDTTFIFMEEGPDKRITRSQLILKVN